MSYIVVDTEKSGGYMVAGKEHATFPEALVARTKWVIEHATDHELSVARADWGLDGLFIFEVLPAGSSVLVPTDRVDPMFSYEPLYLVKSKEGLLIADLEVFEDHNPGEIAYPLVEVANRMDGTIQWSHNTKEPE